jgi:hypothetical protein
LDIKLPPEILELFYPAVCRKKILFKTLSREIILSDNSALDLLA